ncbi:hypothetical protein C0991_007635, partial [Blastosporella zonata]
MAVDGEHTDPTKNRDTQASELNVVESLEASEPGPKACEGVMHDDYGLEGLQKIHSVDEAFT